MRPHLSFSPVLLAALCILLSFDIARTQDNVLLFDYADGGYPPYLFPDEKGNDTGIVHDILSTALDRMGWALAVQYSPERRGQLLLEQGAVDCRGKALEWVTESERYLWSNPIISSTNVLVMRADRPRSSFTAHGLRGCSIATQRGYTYPDFEEAFSDGSILRVDKPTPAEALELVLRMRVDAAILDEATVAYLLNELPEHDANDYLLREIPSEACEYRLMFSPTRDWSDFIQKFNDSLESLRADGTYDKILTAYR